MKFVNYSLKDRVGYVTMTRPEKRNALSFEMVSELKAAFTQAEVDATAKIVVLKAEGDAFCAGADLEALQKFQTMSSEKNLEDSRHLKGLLLQIYTLKKVVIAQVHGHALAGGCGLATVCDFVYAAPEAKLGYTEVRIGFVPALVMVFLLRKIGEQNAKQLLLSGELITSEKAAAIGLINQVVPRSELSAFVEEAAQKLIKNNSQQSMETIKAMVAEVQSMNLTEGLEYAARMNAKARVTEDCKKGVAAFLEKKTLAW